MSIDGWVGAAFAMMMWPLLICCVDVIAGVRARQRRPAGLEPRSDCGCDDFEILVPIYGAIRYLENVDYLHEYGDQVLLCTTRDETAEFDLALDTLAADHGFRIFRGAVDRQTGTARRATGGTVRDRLIRDALTQVSATYVVCIDADTTTSRPLRELIGAMEARDLDLVSIRLVPSNSGTVLARLQAHEYRLSMLLRQVLPWLVSGACHGVRAEVHRDVMSRHSLFFQGNDVELGVIAQACGYRVGHVTFEVPTTVPEQFTPWLRQRLAWSGGEVRLFLANPQLAWRHPLLWMYGLAVAIMASVLRWDSVLHPGWSLLGVLCVYLAFGYYLHRANRDWYLLLLPFYAGFLSLVITPLGIIWYARMVVADRNAGLIRLGRGRELRERWSAEGVSCAIPVPGRWGSPRR